ncbi:MAG: superfamily II DNA/RNA helicase [Patiriisocius sp.]|jgi:superfamily II DNA/RNA helicase
MNVGEYLRKMSKSIKSQEAILAKLGIEQLNPMQVECLDKMEKHDEIMLLSPTGTGKTLGFLLPLISALDKNSNEIQAVIIVPSRELAIQIEQVAREMGTGFKINAVYGGRAGAKDREEIKHRPAILIGTPGRVADHLRRQNFSVEEIKTLVLDEFDKSLEVGFEVEMMQILDFLPNIEKKVLTSATQGVKVPSFVQLKDLQVIDYSGDGLTQLSIKKVLSPKADKLDTLLDLLAHVGNSNGIIFCNFRDSIERVSDFLSDHGISHGSFHGGMEQIDRERALIKFRNGTHKILLSTDLAARGIDVPELKFIVHYHLPTRSEEFTHRNGRTARMNSNGTAYVLHYNKEELPDFIGDIPEEKLTKADLPSRSEWSTLFISGGRKDKISKGDVAGLFFKQGDLQKDELGVIELKTDCVFVSVKKSAIAELIPKVNNMRLKKKKVRVREV